MLRVQAISAGQDVAAVMTNKGITLAPKAGTPLKILFDYSTKGSQVITSTDPTGYANVPAGSKNWYLTLEKPPMPPTPKMRIYPKTMLLMLTSIAIIIGVLVLLCP